MLAYRFILVSCFLVHTQLIFSSTWLINTLGNRNVQPTFSIFVGVSYLLYPAIGWIAEVRLNNFKMIQWSFPIWFLSSMLMLLTAILLLTTSPYAYTDLTDEYVNVACGMLFVVAGLTGLGMYEANAIQFGMDQMLEASSEQLSSFIHWYFWCVHIGPLLVFYVLVSFGLYIHDCKCPISIFHEKLLGFLLLVSSSIQLLTCIFGFLLLKWSKKYFYSEQTSRNSLRIIYKVLKYAYEHKIPERRSAFTYWENDTPSRIDLGKQKYGGPFTYEQVEDVKTFFRLLLLILSLFGFQLSGDGYSLTYYIMNKSGCPTIVPLTIIIVNPQHIPLLFISVGVPVFQLLKKYLACYIPDMLTRLWIGLFLSLVNEALQTTFSLMMVKREFNCPQIYELDFPSLFEKCLFANFNVIRNSSCEHFCSDYPVNFPFVYVPILFLLLYGASYLLIFMTALEFICAQSPTALKGLLIGIWYSLLSIKYMLIYNMDTYPPYLENVQWSIYHGGKGFGIFLSIIVFSLVCKYYHYRERNEVVNEQAIIEEQYERELLNNSLEDSGTRYDN